MSVNAFTWLQWEVSQTRSLRFKLISAQFASVYRVLSLPPAQHPSSSVLSSRLNTLLNRLSETLTDLHRLTSHAHATAIRGSDQGNRLFTHLKHINADLERQRDVDPAWKYAVDKVNHFFVGGEPSKMELIRRDVKITRSTIGSLSTLLQDLQRSRIAIKGFRDQIGYFDASMMGFHLGASSEGGIGPEEELRILADVVDDFGQSVGLARAGWAKEMDDKRSTKQIEG